jgi:hypothetical protein
METCALPTGLFPMGCDMTSLYANLRTFNTHRISQQPFWSAAPFSVAECSICTSYALMHSGVGTNFCTTACGIPLFAYPCRTGRGGGVEVYCCPQMLSRGNKKKGLVRSRQCERRRVRASIYQKGGGWGNEYDVYLSRESGSGSGLVVCLLAPYLLIGL